MSHDPVNPWIDTPDFADFVLPQDEPFVRAFNDTMAKGDKDHRFDLTLPPEPFQGFHQAPLVLLFANPGRSPGDDRAFRRKDVADLSRANLRTPGGVPYFWLNESLNNTPGGEWTRRCMKGLLKLGHTYEDLSRLVMAVEFHGYHSRKWACPPVTIPSQLFGFSLVKKAMEREAVIVVTRAAKFWYVAVPGLAHYGHMVVTHTVRSSSISEGNIGSQGFAKIAQALDS